MQVDGFELQLNDWIQVDDFKLQLNISMQVDGWGLYVKKRKVKAKKKIRSVG